MGEYTMLEAQILHKQGMSGVQIAECLHVDRRTVYNYLNKRVFQREKRGRPIGRSKLSPWHPFINSELESNFYLNGEVLLDKLKSAGYNGGLTILGDYLREKRSTLRNQAVFRFETLPGHQAQVDWAGPYFYWHGVTLKKRYCFVMKCGYSRRSYIEFTHSKEQAVLFACHKRAFEYFGGVFAEILYDNEKTMFLYDTQQQKWKPHPKLLQFGAHYGFIPKRCKVRRPQTKGKVEREVRYLKYSFFPSVVSVQRMSTVSLNEKALQWLKRVDGKVLRDFGQTRLERFSEDLKHMHGLPAAAYDHRAEEPLLVDREGRFRFQTNRYSVPADYIGKKLTGYRDPDTHTLAVYDGKTLIKTVSLLPTGAKEKVDTPADRKSLYAAWEKGRNWQQKQAHKAAQQRKRQAEAENQVQDPAVYDKVFEVEPSSYEEVLI